MIGAKSRRFRWEKLGTWLAVQSHLGTSMRSAPLPFPTRFRPPRRGERGVSLIELLVVVTIIGIFMALAGPTIVSSMQDRHAARGADEVIGFFRRARTHAASSGGAHVIRVTAGSGNLRFELREAVDPTTGFPQSSCLTTPWTSGGPDNKVLDVIDFLNTPSYKGKNIRASGTFKGDICVTPGGMVYVNAGAGWTKPTGDQRYEFVIERLDDTGAAFGIKRTIRIGIGTGPNLEVAG